MRMLANAIRFPARFSLLAKKSFLFGHLFFNITDFSCAQKRVGHACICPRMDTGKSVLRLYPRQMLALRGQKMKIPIENCRYFQSKSLK